MWLKSVQVRLNLLTIVIYFQQRLSEPVSVPNLVVKLANEDNLARGLVLAVKKPSNTTCIKEYLGMLSCGDNPTAVGKAASFISLNSSKVQVEFDVIGRRLRRHVLESVTRERHGNEGVRILRLLMDTGKMDDKQVCFIRMSFYDAFSQG